MNYLRPKKTPKYRQESFVLGFFLFVLLIYLFAPRVFIATADITSTLARPVFGFFGALEEPKKDWQALFLQKKDLLKSYSDLTNDLAEAEARASLSSFLLRERRDREVFGSNESIVGEANVLSLSGESLYGTILISLSQGEARPGNLVVSTNGYLLGRVVSGSERVWRVRLFSASGEKLPVRVGERGDTLMALGVGSGNFLIEAPRAAGIVQGDVVIAPLGVRLPLGVVEYTDEDPTSSVLVVRFQHPENIRNLEGVYIVNVL